jgi:uncharacterized membrane protein YhiD involved in acid resistance
MAGRLETFEQFLTNNPGQIDIPHFILCLLLAALFSYLLGKIYVKYGKAISNRKKFAGNFVLLATTTTLIINVVKSSLALSLGLVGALSIIRFRAAIKEPEELAFLFLAISLGLGFGAGQLAITFVAFSVISLLILGRHFSYKKGENQNLYLLISGKRSQVFNLEKIVEILKRYCNFVHLKRFDESQDHIEVSLLVDMSSLDKLEKIKIELNKFSKDLTIRYLDGINTG